MASPQTLTLGALLRRYRIAAGLTQEELAEKAGLSVNAISAIERGVSRTPQRETVALLAEALNLQTAERTLFEQTARQRASPVSSPRRHEAASAVGEHPFVGRTVELAALDRFLAGAGAPLVLIAGEPGIGKSRLLTVAAERAQAAGWAVVRGACHRRGDSEPYTPFPEALLRLLSDRSATQRRLDLHGCGWLSRLLPELVEMGPLPAPTWTLPPDQERRLIFAAVGQLLANVARPAGTLLLLDDMQWAGADALALLATLIHDAPDPLRLRVIAAYRQSEVTSRDALAEMEADLARERLATRLSLGPLARGEAAALLDALLSDNLDATARERLVQLTGGVPYFLVSVAQESGTGTIGEATGGQAPGAVPWNVAASIRQRVAALSELAREVVALAALGGARISRLVVLQAAAALGYDEARCVAAVDAAAHARLLSEVGNDTYSCAHDLIRETVITDLTSTRRRFLHRLIGEAIERLFETERLPERKHQAAEVAWHFQESGELVRAQPYALMAGDQAEAVFAHAEAERHYRTAAEGAQDMGDVRAEAEAREKLGNALYLQARYEQAVPELERAASLYRLAGDHERRWQTVARIGSADEQRGQLDRGLEQLQAAIAESTAVAQSEVLYPRALASLYIQIAEVYVQGDRCAEALAAAERAAELAQRAGDAQMLITARGRVGLAQRRLGYRDEAERALLDAVRLGEETGNLAAAGASLVNLYDIHLHRGEFNTAAHFLQRAVDIDEHTENVTDFVFTVTCLVEWAYFQGDWAAAESHSERAQRLFERTGPSYDALYVPLQRGLLRLALGYDAEAVQALTEVITAGQSSGDVQALGYAEWALAERDLLRGDYAGALARLEVALAHTGRIPLDASLLSLRAWAELLAGDIERAESTFTQALEVVSDEADKLGLVDVERIHALLLMHQHRWTEAERALEDGLGLARGMPYPYAEAKLLYIYGLLHSETGEPERARERFAAALAICDQLGERHYRPLIERALARLDTAAAG